MYMLLSENFALAVCCCKVHITIHYFILLTERFSVILVKTLLLLTTMGKPPLVA